MNESQNTDIRERNRDHPPARDSRHLTFRAAAALLGLKLSTVHQYMARGRIPEKCVIRRANGRRWRLDRAKFEKWMAEEGNGD